METHQSNRIVDIVGQRWLRWFPVPVLLGAALVSFSLWQGARTVDVASVDAATRIHAAHIGSEVVRRAAPFTDALQRLADAERARRRGEVGTEPRLLAGHSLARFSSLFAVALVDRENGLRWVQARTPVTTTIADLQAIEQACDAVLRRPVALSPTLVNRADLRAGGSGFVIAVPVLDRGRIVSFVIGLFRHDDFFSATIGEALSADYQYRVFEGSRELFRRSDPSWRDAHVARVAIPFLNATWDAEIAPLPVGHAPPRPGER